MEKKLRKLEHLIQQFKRHRDEAPHETTKTVTMLDIIELQTEILIELDGIITELAKEGE